MQVFISYRRIYVYGTNTCTSRRIESVVYTFAGPKIFFFMFSPQIFQGMPNCMYANSSMYSTKFYR
jgi:hypothetical protein